jgi:predicted GH43/DUF377 family glycosyl hydrolase
MSNEPSKKANSLNQSQTEKGPRTQLTDLFCPTQDLTTHLLPTIDDDKKNLISNAHAQFNKSGYSDGLSQHEFATLYVSALSKVVTIAKRFLESDLTTIEMDKEKIRLESHQSTSIPKITVPKISNQWNELRTRYETSIRSEIVRLAEASPEDNELCLRGICLALLVRAEMSRQQELTKLLQNGGRASLNMQTDIMQRALEASGEQSGNLSVVMENFCKICAREQMIFPKLEVVLDFDGNLTRVPESGSPWKPGEQTNAETINTIDRICDLPPYMRLVMTEFPGSDPNRVALAEALYNIAGQESELFADSGLLLRHLEANGIDNFILTGNNSNLVQSKIADEKLPIGGIVGLSPDSWYPDKVQYLLHRLLKTKDGADFEPKIVLYCDDRDKPICDAVRDERSISNVFFFAARSGAELHQALKQSGASFVLNRVNGGGRGFEETLSFIDSYLRTRALSVDVRIQGEEVYRATYKKGDVLKECEVAVERNLLMPRPVNRTILVPDRDEKSVARGNEYQQYDLGCPAAFLDTNEEMMLLYKAANGPSKSNRDVNFHNPNSMSNVFGARFDLRSGNVSFVDHSGQLFRRPSEAKYFLDPRKGFTADDGVHDPRITRLNADGQTLVTAVAFDKSARTTDMINVAGDLNKPIRGAVTMLYESKDPYDPRAYEFKGQLGPDQYLKNLVFFEGMNSSNDSLFLCIRKMPGIQIIPISRETIDKITSNATERAKFWEDMLDEDKIKEYTVLNPALVHEGNGNPLAPQNKGQLAPAFAPTPVTINGPHGKESYYLMIYNSVPDFRSDVSDPAFGRVINAALLDINDPWKVVSRGPLPIVLPRSKESFISQEGITGRNYNVAFAAGGGITDKGKLVVVYTEHDTVVRTAEWDSAIELVEYLKNFDSVGNSKWLAKK